MNENKTTALPYIIQGDNIIVVLDNKSHSFSKTHIAYDRLKSAIKDNDWQLVRDFIDPKKVIVDYGNKNISIQGDKFFWKDIEMHNTLTNQLIRMFQQGFSVEPLVNFMENLMSNPSKRAVDELYGFLEKGKLPITPDGYFLAYKKVNASYLDVHSGTVPNKLADAFTKEELDTMPIQCGNSVTVSVVDDTTVIEMARNFVDDDKNRTCSAGLHFASEDYLANFVGERIMILKINPRDVVAIPADYNSSKGRTCRYEVVGEVADFYKPSASIAETVDTTYVGKTEELLGQILEELKANKA